MASAEDTEITLGTGKMLLLFFGLVALCAVFFGMGFSLGKTSAKPGGDATAGATAPGGVRPTAVKGTSPRPPSDLTFYKAVGQKDPNAQLAANSTDTPSNAKAAPNSPPADNNAPPDLTAVSPQSAYYVQVAAVSKQEDAGALVDALKKKQYTAFATAPGDKLFHVQVGPFSDVKDAELARGKLVSDGYNPILKK
ncbi:MAG TPA: SPOR domain-containing protein [Terriglobales bacterium]|jgi:cell division septation protein DedD|nr:SPOR domain-containing protein [Terriglobales bacterium]